MFLKGTIQPETVTTNDRPEVTSPPTAVKTNQESSQKPATKTGGSTQSAQTQTRHSTTQTPNTTHNVHQGIYRLRFMLNTTSLSLFIF